MLIGTCTCIYFHRVFLELKSQQNDTVVEIIDESQDDSEKLKSIGEPPTIDLDADDKAENDDVVITDCTLNTSADKTDQPEKEELEKSQSNDKTIETKEETEKSESSPGDENVPTVEQKETNEEKTENNDEEIKISNVEIKIDNPDIKVDDEVEQMSVVSNNSGDNGKTATNELVVEWTLQEMEAWLDDPEPPLNRQQLKDMFITMQVILLLIMCLLIMKRIKLITFSKGF